jgi:penicillin-insensitive murein endopeptidase
VRSAPLAAAIVTCFLTVSAGAWPGSPPKRPQATAHISAGSAALRFGRSVGSPTEGHLVGGVHLDETPYMRVSPAHAGGDVRWGLEPLVTAIDRAARAVRRQFPDAVATVGHLSRQGGGEVDRHHSHESGRDADVQFYVHTRANKPLLANGFVAFRGDGSAPHWPGALFDDVRNWVFVHALITDPQAHVTHIFVAAPLRARLLSIAEHLGAPMAVRMRAAEILTQPRGALPHDDHFHVRVACPSRQQGCVENPTAPSAAIAQHAPHAALHGRRGAPAVPAAHPTQRPRVAPAPRPASAPTSPPVKGSGEAGEHDLDAPPGMIPYDDADGPVD